MPLPPNLALLGNDADRPTENPKLFEHHKLREEQLKSLAWMISREAGRGLRGGVLGDKMGYGKTATAIALFSLDKLNAAPPLPLVNKIPTRATLILCPPRLQQQWLDEMNKFIGESLEVWHVFGDECVCGKEATRSPSLKVLSIATRKPTLRAQSERMISSRANATAASTSSAPDTVRTYPLVTVEMLGNYDVVIASIDLMQHHLYLDSVKKTVDSTLHQSNFLTSDWMWMMERSFRVDREATTARLSAAPFPVFQAFWWRRIIIDEFHESAAWEYKNRELVRAIGATKRWGLSGTPPLDTSAAVTDVALLLGYHEEVDAPAMKLWSQLEQAGVKKTENFLVSHGLELEAEALTFLKTCVRQNSSKLVDDIGVEEHIEYPASVCLLYSVVTAIVRSVYVAHPCRRHNQLIDRYVELTREERIIYRQACHEEGVYDLGRGYEHVDLTVRARLLHRCARFDVSDGAETASQAVTNLGEKVKQEKSKILQQLRLDYYRAAYLDSELAFASKLRSASSRYPLVQRYVEDILAEGPVWHRDALVIRGRYVAGQQVCPLTCYGNASAVHAMTHGIASRIASLCTTRPAGLCTFLRSSQLCEQACKPGSVSRALLHAADKLSELLDVAQRNKNFYDAQVRCMTSANFTEDCSICMEPLGGAELVTLCPCSHYFHTGCAHKAVKSSSACPICRRPTQLAELSPMSEELAPLQTETTDAHMSFAHKKHGSKLNAIASRLRKIRCSDPTAQVIVYTQWLELEDYVEKALQAHRVPCARMANKSTCGQVLREFQENRGPWVLLLSLSEHPSGLNITAASHVMFVHPMNAASLAAARSYEEQAIGRIKRIGQQRSCVHVWRFVTRRTVEEHVVKLHNAQEVAGLTLQEVGGARISG